MPRIFCRFPDRSFGIGLLMLRVAEGATAGLHGILALIGIPSVMSEAALINGVTVLAGICLLLGLFTPIMSVLAFVGYELVTHVPRHSSAGLDFNDLLQIVFAFLLACGIALVGPGAYSLDARLFGRRQVIIPRVPNSDEE